MPCRVCGEKTSDMRFGDPLCKGCVVEWQRCPKCSRSEPTYELVWTDQGQICRTWSDQDDDPIDARNLEGRHGRRYLRS